MILSSTAGHEASGNGSMKFLMNGCLILVTADGSTVEIIEKIGADDMVTIIFYQGCKFTISIQYLVWLHLFLNE